MTAATRYFLEQVLRKRPYLSLELCVAALVAAPGGTARRWADPVLAAGNLAKRD